MNGKIDSRGWLHIERAGQYVTMECRPGGQGGGDGFVYCTHHCPLFGEPEPILVFPQGNMAPSEPKQIGTTLHICQSETLNFKVFTDERPNP